MLRSPWLLASAALLLGCGSDAGTDAPRSRGAASGEAGATGGSTGAAGDSFGNADGQGLAGASGQGGATDGKAPDQRAVCVSTELVPTVEKVRLPGNVLIVFDKSGSMTDGWSGGQKWTSATAAVPAAFEPVIDDLALVGAIFFPSPPACSVDAIDSGNQIDFMDAPAFMIAWQNFVTTSSPDGNTPLHTALMSADAALMNPALEHTTSVVVVTDGAPNCLAGGGPKAPPVTPTVSPYPALWLARSIKTYVVGLPGSAGAIKHLNETAMAGGTMQYIPADDPATLEMHLGKIVEESTATTFGCDITVDPAPDNPEDVHVIVVEAGEERDVPRDLGASGGWSINADGTRITLEGQLCKEAMNGTYEKVSVEFGCVSLPLLPPPRPD